MIWAVLTVVAAVVLLGLGVVLVACCMVMAWAHLVPADWPVEETCSNPHCRHEDYEHQTETPDGACQILNCGCRRMERGT